MFPTRYDIRNRRELTEMQRESAAAAIFKKYWGIRRLAVRILEVFLKPLRWWPPTEVNPSLDGVERILVFEPGSLGDMVMLMPFLKSLRMRFPQANLSLLCRAGGKKGQSYASLDQASVKTLLLDQGLVDELIPVGVPWLAHVSPWKKYHPFSLKWPVFAWSLLRLRRRGFDLSFPSGRSDIRYNLVLWLTGAKRRVGYGYAGAGFLLTDVVMPDLTRPHQTEVCLRLLEHLGIPAIRSGQFLKLSSEDEAYSIHFFKEHEIEADGLIVGIHAGSRVASRTWGQDRFREVAERLAGEFGASARLNSAARLAWLRLVRSTCASNGIGWALWGYDDVMGFDVRRPPGNKPELDRSVLKALGLTVF